MLVALNVVSLGKSRHSNWIAGRDKGGVVCCMHLLGRKESYVGIRTNRSILSHLSIDIKYIMLRLGYPNVLLAIEN
jgi:hypothetical protein